MVLRPETKISPIIVALDFDNERAALAVAAQLPAGSIVKVGKHLHTAAPGIVQTLIKVYHLLVFLDLKFKDIPNTVAAACRVAARQGVWMMNLHADGGSKMMCAAMEAVKSFGDARPLLVGVTVLTSMDEEDLIEVGVNATPAEQVLNLATLTHTSGLDGVVCSPREAAMLRAQFGTDFLLVTPGVRSAGATRDDQKRTDTPTGAIHAGADYLVVGRPITQAPDVVVAYRQFDAEAHKARAQLSGGVQ